ncbi:MAG: hypothetical protein ACFCUG_07560 [Thiotrichales bacterium]
MLWPTCFSAAWTAILESGTPVGGKSILAAIIMTPFLYPAAFTVWSVIAFVIAIAIDIRSLTHRPDTAPPSRLP